VVYSLLAEAWKKQTPVTAGQRSSPAATAGTNPLRCRGLGQFERALRDSDGGRGSVAFAGDLHGRKANLMPFSSNALLMVGTAEGPGDRS
jgi:hypothetical protein